MKLTEAVDTFGLPLIEATIAEKIVYHGSPKAFDKFTLDFAGETQGVNIAWGLYFSEVPEGAAFYKKLGQGNGKLYKVKIPEGPYLDWNKTVAAQPPKVRAILRKTDRWSEANDRAKTGKFLSGDQLKGSEFYHGAAHYGDMTEKEVSEWLYSLGIKGVRYQHDTYHNIVLFNADDAKIVSEVDSDTHGESADAFGLPITEKKAPEDVLPKDSEIREFFYMSDRKSNEEQWIEDAKEQFNSMDDVEIDEQIEHWFNECNWDYEEFQEELEKLSPEKQREKKLEHFITSYVHDREEYEDSSQVYFENPRVIRNATLYRFTPAKTDEVLKNGFRGYGPQRLGLTHHETPGMGDLSFAFEKKDLKSLKAVKEMAAKYGHNLFEFKVPYAVKVYHNTDYEDQVVFDVTTVSNLKFIGKVGGTEVESFMEGISDEESL